MFNLNYFSMSVVYYPYTHPSRRFDRLSDAHRFIDSGVIPWWNFHCLLGVFVVKEDLCTGKRTLYTHYFPWQKENLKKYKSEHKRRK